MVLARRLELGYSSQSALAGEGEPKLGNSTIQHLELGHVVPAREDTRSRYEQKLRWERGTFHKILNDPDHVPVTVKATGVQLEPGKVTFPAVVAAIDEITDTQREKLLVILLDRVQRSRSRSV